MLSQFYREHLNSRLWAMFRAYALEAAEHRCERCWRPVKLRVHHLHYETVGRESLDDVKVLCGTCHRVEHDSVGPVIVCVGCEKMDFLHVPRSKGWTGLKEDDGQVGAFCCQHCLAESYRSYDAGPPGGVFSLTHLADVGLAITDREGWRVNLTGQKAKRKTNG